MEDRRFCVPVVRRGGIFQQAGVPTGKPDDLLPYRDLAAFLSRHYSRETGMVHVFGHSAEARVFVPHDPSDLSYVLVDGDLNPLDHGEGPAAPREAWSQHLSSVLSSHLAAISGLCGVTDGMFGPTRFELPFGFIRPTLRRRRLNFLGLPTSGSAADKNDYSVEELVREPRAVILGPPGAGKTTLSRFLALRLAAECADGIEEGAVRQVPVYVQLRHHDFRQAWSSASALSSLRETRSPTSALRFAWVLDGLDEVPPENLGSAKQAIKDLVTQRTQDAVFLCSRVASYDGFLERECAHFELQPLSWAQTCQWVNQYVRTFDETRTPVLLRHLANVPELRSVASNPLLLSLLTHQFQFEGVVPQQRVQLLERFVSTLCVDWDSSRGVTRDEPGAIRPYRRSTALGWLAFEMKLRGATSISNEEADSWLTKYPPLRSGAAGEGILGSLAASTGLLVASAPGRWEFSHSLLSDYLVARHLVSRTEDISPLFEALAGGDSWHEVWVLACAVTDDAGPLLVRVLSSEVLPGETKALLIAGALAQGVDAERDLMDRCRTLLGEVFARHSQVLNASRVNDSATGERLSLLVPAPLWPEAGANGASQRFIRSLLVLLYRATWWERTERVISELRERGGTLGLHAAQVLQRDGVVDASGGTVTSGGREDVLIEIESGMKPKK